MDHSVSVCVDLTLIRRRPILGQCSIIDAFVVFLGQKSISPIYEQEANNLINHWCFLGCRSLVNNQVHVGSRI